MRPLALLVIFTSLVSASAFGQWHEDAWNNPRLATPLSTTLWACARGPFSITNFVGPFPTNGPSTNKTVSVETFLSDISSQPNRTNDTNGVSWVAPIVGTFNWGLTNAGGIEFLWSVTVTNMQTEQAMELQARDVVALDCYRAVKERSDFLNRTSQTIRFFRGNRDALVSLKSSVNSLLPLFLPTNQFQGDYFSTNIWWRWTTGATNMWKQTKNAAFIKYDASLLCKDAGLPIELTRSTVTQQIEGWVIGKLTNRYVIGPEEVEQNALGALEITPWRELDCRGLGLAASNATTLIRGPFVDGQDTPEWMYDPDDWSECSWELTSNCFPKTVVESYCSTTIEWIFPSITSVVTNVVWCKDFADGFTSLNYGWCALRKAIEKLSCVEIVPVVSNLGMNAISYFSTNYYCERTFEECPLDISCPTVKYGTGSVYPPVSSESHSFVAWTTNWFFSFYATGVRKEKIRYTTVFDLGFLPTVSTNQDFRADVYYRLKPGPDRIASSVTFPYLGRNYYAGPPESFSFFHRLDVKKSVPQSWLAGGLSIPMPQDPECVTIHTYCPGLYDEWDGYPWDGCPDELGVPYYGQEASFKAVAYPAFIFR